MHTSPEIQPVGDRPINSADDALSLILISPSSTKLTHEPETRFVPSKNIKVELDTMEPTWDECAIDPIEENELENVEREGERCAEDNRTLAPTAKPASPRLSR